MDFSGSAFGACDNRTIATVVPSPDSDFAVAFITLLISDPVPLSEHLFEDLDEYLRMPSNLRYGIHMALPKTIQNHETDNHSPYMDEWQAYFLGIAKAVAKKSKDPRCSVGAVVVSRDHLVLSTGFNGLARGIYDTSRVLHDVDEKLRWICHAEANAILNGGRKGVSLENGQIIVTKFPCLFCCNLIVQSGITTICTDDEKFWDDDAFDRPPHTRKKALLREARVTVVAPPNHPFFDSLLRRNQRRKPKRR